MKQSLPLRDIYVARYTKDGILDNSFIRVNQGDGIFTHPAIAPDGNYVAYWGRSQGNLDVWVVDLRTHSAKPITQGLGVSCHPAWSPDSRQLAYAYNPEFLGDDPSTSLYDGRQFSPRNIWILNIDTWERKSVTSNGLDNERPAWSSDGRFMAYVTGNGEKKNIRVMDMLSGVETYVTDTKGICYRPAWHPSGNYLAFNNKGSGSHYLWMIDADGRNLRQITPCTAEDVLVHDHGSFWLSDGHDILFHSDRGGKYGLWLIDIDDRRMRTVMVPGVKSLGHASLDACEQLICFDMRRNDFAEYPSNRKRT